MPGKMHVPAPIDRPLSRAYLREFSGWQTNYPPGLSDPNSLRLMDNVWIRRDGSVAVRPGLRLLTKLPAELPLSTEGLTCVGSHEAFFLNNGNKAYLFAVRETDGTVGFRVGEYDEDAPQLVTVRALTDATPGFSVPQGLATLAFTSATTYVKYLQIDNRIFALSNAGEPMRVFWVGTTKIARKIVSVTRPSWTTADKLAVVHPDQTEFPTPTAPVTAETKTAGTAGDNTTGTLISSTAKDNQYNFGYFYTFTNEIGESAPSQITVVKAKRRWSAWAWETPNASGEPSGTATADPTAAADQLVATVPSAAFTAALAEGATSWNLYMLTWSDQDPVPAQAVLIASKTLTGSSTWAADGWLRHTPSNADYNFSAPLPNITNRFNYSDPAKAGQGLVAADRLVLVYDPTDPAKIRWSSNQQGNYSDFSASKGGGYKTLTSGNLFIPACVKLWQNPQSVDTLTILCLGTDGYSTSYYMAPAQVTSQSESTTIMGFEETTATPGTVSPYGVEVFNNALYHPLDDQLAKSSVSMYNINRKSVTDDIRNRWVSLANSHQIVSSQLDSRLYYLVHNPNGGALDPGCMGNEIWMLDAAATTPTWSRWTIQASSLRKLQLRGKLYMGVVKPEGIFYLDELASQDEVVSENQIVNVPIRWSLETNTQGANRAHDAWCHLQQVSVTLGNFSGRMRWGIRGWDVNGKPVEVAKETSYVTPEDVDPLEGTDLEDFLLVRRQMKEWFFFAENVSVGGNEQPCGGAICYVQYRYAPISVNVGYEYGTVESFEYQRAVQTVGAEQLTTNGVPIPYVDQRTP